MVYQTPTTAEEMYEVLEQIYYDYRLKIDGYEDAGLIDLVLDKMEFTPKSEEELFYEARALVTPWYDAELLKARKVNSAKIDALNKKLKELEKEKEERKTSLEKEILESSKKIEKEGIKKGYYNSDLMLDKIAKLEELKLEKLQVIENEFLSKKIEISNEISTLEEYEANLESDYNVYFDNKIQAKFLELKDTQEEREREVFKYNNGLVEKEKRNKNTNISANASLKLRYLEIRTKAYSREELVDMGYYNEVIKCVYAYYNSIENQQEAYRQFLNDTKVIVYLEDYYENVLAVYRAKAGL